MAKLTLEDLRKLRKNKQAEFKHINSDNNKVEIIIGMGTCGIAAGAKETLDAFLNEIEKRNLDGIAVKQTGCMGYCSTEPTVEIKMSGMPDTIYGNVNEEIARRIVGVHIANKELVNEHVFDKPSRDIITGANQLKGGEK